MNAFNGCSALTSITATCKFKQNETSWKGNCNATVIWGHTFADDATSFATCACGEKASSSCGGNAWYLLNEATGTLTISGTGPMTDYNSLFQSSFTRIYRSSIRFVVIKNGITSIGEYAFYKCTSLTSITIPDSVTSIGNHAFQSCTALTSITIPDSVTSIGNDAFNECTSLKSITIPESVTRIVFRAFQNCSSLESITIPDSVTTLGDTDGDVFNGCTKLKNITAPCHLKGNASIVNAENNGAAVTWSHVFAEGSDTCDYGDAIKGSCGDNATYEFDKATGTLTISGTGAIKVSAFDHDDKTWVEEIKKVEIKSGITSIGFLAFYYCSSLTSITIPDSVTSIGAYTFYGCSSLSSITIPDGVTSIGNNAFNSCSKLESIKIPDGVTSIGNSAFRDCSKLESIKIPDGVKSIGDRAFYKCIALTNITIPNSVTSIGYNAFFECSSLTSITIPDSVTTLGDTDGDVFDYCKKLKSITAPCRFKNNVEYPSVDKIAATNGATVTWSHVGDEVTDERVEPNCTEDGHEAGKYCSVCNATLEGMETIPATGHTEVTDERVEPTCTETGLTEGKHCSVCGEVLVAQEVIPANGHTFVNGKCTDCGAVKCGDNAWYLFDESTGVLTISGTGPMTDYMTLTSSPFYKNTDIKSIVIADGITSIGNYAFSGCSSLTSITIPDGVTSIGKCAFWKCTSLTSITIPDSVTSIGESAFDQCSNLESIKIPDGVTSIGDSTFYYCFSLTSITIPNSVTSIGNNAFFDCSSLSSITIPNSVTNIGNSAFAYCSSLTNITIPNSVTEIGFKAFSGCSNLASITIPDSVTTLGGTDGDVFNVCKKLKNITAPCRFKNNVEYPSVDKIAATNGATVTWSHVGDEVTDEIVEPTCTEDGLTEGKHCSVCEEDIVKQEVILATGHTEVTDERVEPTCTEDGLTEGKHCSVCGEVIVAQEVISATGKHTFENGKCTVCDKNAISGASLALGGTLKVNIKFNADITEADGFTINDEPVVTTNGIYTFEAPAAKFRGDIVIAQNGYVIKETNIGNMIETYKGYENEEAVAKSLEAYCIAAENYFSNGTVKDYSSEWTTIAEEIGSHEVNMGENYDSSSLILKENTILRHYYTSEIAGYTGIKGGYYYTDEVILAHKYFDADKYCVNDYIYKALTSDKADANLKNLCVALYKYGVAAKNYNGGNK